MRKIPKIILYCCYLCFAVLTLSELIFRIYFALEISPRVLAYGTNVYENIHGSGRRERIEKQYDKELENWQKEEDRANTVYSQDRKMGGYRKFFPNEEKYHRDDKTGEQFLITINSQGFRGAEFQEKKAPGVIRVLTLGASSTFGFFNRENETYPYQLQKSLNDYCGRQRFEVINFAIPRSTADNIRNMVIAEGIALEPDVMTFYEGRNDSDQIGPIDFVGGIRDETGLQQGIWQFLTRKIIVFRIIDLMVSKNIKLTIDQTRETLEARAEKTSRAFLADLEDIHRLARSYNILLILANQQASSRSWFQVPHEERKQMRGLTYTEEARQIIYRLQRGESISGYEYNFLIHQRLMEDLGEWARKHNLPFVDIVKLLDSDRHHLVSYVHLDAYANRIIAKAFAEEILKHFDCGTSRTKIRGELKDTEIVFTPSN